MLEALFAGHGGKGVVDTCLQIELAVFLLQSFGDEDDVDTGKRLCRKVMFWLSFEGCFLRKEWMCCTVRGYRR